MKLKQGERLVFAGDSVTDAGRNHPVAAGTLFDPLGKGYPNIVSGWINAVYPALGINVINAGTGGNTSRDLRQRWDNEILSVRPDWLSIMIGINDIWRQFDSPAQPELHIHPTEYEANLDAMLAAAKSKVQGGIIVMAPFYLELNRADAMLALTLQYAAIARAMAQKHETLFIDTQAHFDRLLASRHPNFIAWDRVHPNNVGHTLLARAFLEAIDFDFKA
ncbi:SGNH/GDSL hydrolase family protein [Victivallis sp. Marseille-Q1083]|uniref:SGNH/GDSL hydrolase family protein n=1 Tax=Victivallis sp. Marseille-Q1083 TaxID=2717288 RepID=UPI00158E15EC|nr:SGNH/GDSL hydrolase family protein [Victivallis sp. Marseille-Q1083]